MPARHMTALMPRRSQRPKAPLLVAAPLMTPLVALNVPLLVALPVALFVASLAMRMAALPGRRRTTSLYDDVYASL